MFSQSQNGKSLGLSPPLYVLFYGLGAFIVATFALDTENALAFLPTALFVYAGAAITGLTFTLSGGIRTLLPTRKELFGLVPLVAAMSASGALFWYVAVEVSILIVTAAFPLKVIVERQVASWVFKADIAPGSDLSRRLKARRLVDLLMATALLGLGVSASTAGEPFSLTSLGLLVLLVAGGVASDLFLTYVQLKDQRNEKVFSPAKKVLYLNFGIVLTLMTALLFLGKVTDVVAAATAWQMPLLLTVGALGVGLPTVIRLKLIEKGIHAAEVCVLALGFPGGAYLVKIAFAAITMVAGIMFDATPAIDVLQSDTSFGVVDLLVSVAILMFVVDRIYSDHRAGGGDGPGAGDRQPQIRGEEAMPTLPRSLRVESEEDLKFGLWSDYLAAEAKFLLTGSTETLKALRTARKELGLDSYRALPDRLLTTRANGGKEPSSQHLEHIRAYADLRKAMRSGAPSSDGTFGNQARQLRETELKILRLTLKPGRYALAYLRQRTVLAALLTLERTAARIAKLSAPFAKRLDAIAGDTGLERWAHRTAWVLRQFFTYEALLHTGLETSWGFRFVIPGTAGFGINAGGWMMFYSGSLFDLMSQSVPMRINPGFTVASPIFVWTVNRPGIGYGPSVPWGNAYVDAQRYKLLIGFDGVGYVRTGEWRGRGPYSTVSGSLPFLPLVRITWNASVFSPGFLPLVRHTTPLAERLQTQAEDFTNFLLRSTKLR